MGVIIVSENDEEEWAHQIDHVAAQRYHGAKTNEMLARNTNPVCAGADPGFHTAISHWREDGRNIYGRHFISGGK